MSPQLRGTALVVVSGVAFGLMPVLAVRAYAAGVSVTTLLLVRFAVASVVLAAVAPAVGGVRRPTPRQAVAALLLGGGLYAAQSSLYFAAVGRIAPALAVLVLYLYPSFVALATSWREHTRPSGRLSAALALSFGGVAAAGGRPDGTVDAVGLGLAFAAACTYAGYVLAGGVIAAELPPVQVSAMVTGAAAMAFAAFRWVAGAPDVFPPRGAWPEIATLAVVCGGVAIATFLAGIPLIGPARAAVLSTLEPAVGVLATAWWLGEAPSAAQWAGVAFVLAGAMLAAFPAGDRPGARRGEDPGHGNDAAQRP